MNRPGIGAIETLPMFDVPDESLPRVVAGQRETADVEEGKSVLPAVLDVETAGRLLGLGRSAAYQLVKDGAWPSPVLRLGRRWRVPTAPLLALLNIEAVEPSAVGATLRRSLTTPAIFRHDEGDQR